MKKLRANLRRLRLLIRGVLTNRDGPDFAGLRAIEDPEEFVWAILPHAARSFAASILTLPSARAKVAAVAYLYCRMLDTFEDLHPDTHTRPGLLTEFGRRFDQEPPAPAGPIPDARIRDNRDRAHLLLVERCELVDEVFGTLQPADRERIRTLVSNMAEGMARSARRFNEQGGVLTSDEQLADYCHAVIGEPALFAIELLLHIPIDETIERDAMEVAELIQLANITRDIEKDLERGIAYHPSLRDYLEKPDGGEAAHAVREVREHMVWLALSRAPAYRRLVTAARFRPISETRGAAVMMLLFTSRYYRTAMERIGRTAWAGPTSVWSLYASAALAAVWPGRAGRVIARVERDFLQAADEIAGKHVEPGGREGTAPQRWEARIERS